MEKSITLNNTNMIVITYKLSVPLKTVSDKIIEYFNSKELIYAIGEQVNNTPTYQNVIIFINKEITNNELFNLGAICGMLDITTKE